MNIDDQAARHRPDLEERVTVLETMQSTSGYARHIDDLQRQIDDLRAALEKHMSSAGHEQCVHMWEHRGGDELRCTACGMTVYRLE